MATQQLGQEGFRWFIGLVEDINDPLQLGRVKVRIINEHDEKVTTDDLDWAHPLTPVTSASVEGVGETPSLSVGSRVVGFFMDGNEKQIAMILGSFPTIPSNDDNLHSISWLARGKNLMVKNPIGSEPPSSYRAEYPFNKVIATRSGHAIELDDTPENERIHIYHKSGAYIEIDSKGSMVIKSAADSYDITDGNKSIHVEGDCTIKVTGDLNATVDGNVTLKASRVDIESDTVTISGDLYVEGEVTGKGVRLSTHTHGGVDRGGSSTNRPN